MTSPGPEASDWRSLYPFESRWLQTPHGRLHYLDEGSAEASAVLFVHGNPTWSFHWRRLISACRGNSRCVAIDHLGCGLSDKPDRSFSLADRIEDLGRLVDDLGLQHVTLVAQDWGGAIGLGAMLDRIDRLERIVLFNTGAWPPRSIPRRIRACRTPVLGKLALQGANLFSRAALRMTLSRSRLDPAVAAGYLAPYDSWANRRAVYQFVADIPASPREPTWSTLASLERRLPELACTPIQLVWGMDDWCFTATECLQRFRSVWPHAQVLELAGVGHWVVEDAPTESLTALRDFAPHPVA